MPARPARQVKQQARIVQGVKSGELTKAEAGRHQDRLNRRIYVQKHDGQSR